MTMGYLAKLILNKTGIMCILNASRQPHFSKRYVCKYMGQIRVIYFTGKEHQNFPCGGKKEYQTLLEDVMFANIWLQKFNRIPEMTFSSPGRKNRQVRYQTNCTFIWRFVKTNFSYLLVFTA